MPQHKSEASNARRPILPISETLDPLWVNPVCATGMGRTRRRVSRILHLGASAYLSVTIGRLLRHARPSGEHGRGVSPRYNQQDGRHVVRRNAQPKQFRQGPATVRRVNGGERFDPRAAEIVVRGSLRRRGVLVRRCVSPEHSNSQNVRRFLGEKK
jgi:hypothetical protein